ncbi:MAG: sigma-70 family RNA polymerase sigma factor [Candidatus Pristimantibacillus lignocellulolyticus]|uniref:Sigma-70 family RNA polymerase sigma factor n=1 Tax=Candidatus Pristimantibacillus lignocellulolyticus TaxID=2994561 RepID=A0A9J6ZJR6_9BACL|nr:MAG: sigma-70 family RNA polymerase sigma factor [Candidatus Pristimantibacillus lignocellulolyticus]
MNKRYALDELYRRYVKSLYFYLYKLCGSASLAEDLTQETFVRATIHIHTYKDEEARAWLFKVARNVYLDEWRKQQRYRKIPFLSSFIKREDSISPYGLPEKSLLEKELAQQLEDLLQYLPENYRSIIYLREYEQFSYAEIMDALQMSEDQVKVTLHRARKRLAGLAMQKGWDYDRVE